MPEDQREPPDIYVDSVQMTVSVYGLAMTLGLNPPHPAGPNAPNAEPQVVVRMSLEHAKVVAMLLRKNLKNYERETGEIPLPPELYTRLGIAKEDWGL